MTNLTVRNIPQATMEKIRYLSDLERRSINSEILVILDQAVNIKYAKKKIFKKQMSKEEQIAIWKDIAGQWEDDRSTEEIIDDIYKNRTLGRKFNYDSI